MWTTWVLTLESFNVRQDTGVDSFSTPQILAFAVELYENGILTDKDFAGNVRL